MMATVAAHLNYVAALIGLVGWGLYFRTLLSGHVRTMPMNWLATAIIAFTASVTTAELSSIPHAALYLVNTVCALTVVAKSLPNLEKVRRADGLLIGLGLLMFACAFRWPQYAALLVSAYYVLNYLSMGLRVLRGQGVEHPAGWLAWACGASVLAFSLRHHGGYSELVPVTNIVVWSWMGSIATYRRWLGTRASAPDTMHGATLNVVVEPDDAAPGEVACELEAPAAAHQMTGATLAPVCQAEKHGPRSAGRDGAGPALALGQYPSVVAFRLDDARRMRLDHVHDTHFPTLPMPSRSPRAMNIHYKAMAGLALAAVSSAAVADTTTITIPFGTMFSSVGQAIQRVVAPATARLAPAPRAASLAPSAPVNASQQHAVGVVHSAQDALRLLKTAAAAAPADIRTCMRDAIANGNLDASSFQRAPDGGYSAHWDGAMVMLGLLAYYGVSPHGQVEIATDCTSTGPSVPRLGNGKVLTYFTTRPGGHPSAALRQWVLAPNNAPIEPHAVAVHAPSVHRTVAMAAFLRGG